MDEQAAGGARARNHGFLTEIGEGGFGTVHLAADVASARTYVVKLGRPGVREGIPSRWPHLLPRLRALAGHPNVLAVIDGGTTEAGRPYLVLEQAIGGSLADRLTQEPLDVLPSLRVGIQLAGALEATHRIGLVHGDIKPSNVLFDRRGDALLADASIGSLSAGRSAPVRTYLASVEHLAPEVLAGGALSPEADQYALGSLLHTMVTGQPVFPLEPGEPLLEYARRVRTVVLPRLADLDWPPDLGAVVERLLAKDPADRFASMRDVGQALQSADYARRGAATPLHVRLTGADAPVDPPIDLRDGAHRERRSEPEGRDDWPGWVDEPVGAHAGRPDPGGADDAPPARRTARRSPARRRVLVGGAVAAGALLVVGSWMTGGTPDGPDTEVLDETEVNTVTTTSSTTTSTTTTTTTVVLPPLDFPDDFVPMTEPPE